MEGENPYCEREKAGNELIENYHHTLDTWEDYITPHSLAFLLSYSFFIITEKKWMRAKNPHSNTSQTFHSPAFSGTQYAGR